MSTGAGKPISIKEHLLHTLGMFWDKLKTTYVTSTASNAGNNLALAASAGYNLQQQINNRTTDNDISSTFTPVSGVTVLERRIRRIGNQVIFYIEAFKSGAAANQWIHLGNMSNIPLTNMYYPVVVTNGSYQPTGHGIAQVRADTGLIQVIVNDASGGYLFISGTYTTASS